MSKMKLDCSKISNKGDLVAILGLVAIAAILGVAVALAVYGKSFLAGFFCATILWKWRDWLYMPIDAWLDRLGRKKAALKTNSRQSRRQAIPGLLATRVEHSMMLNNKAGPSPCIPAF